MMSSVSTHLVQFGDAVLGDAHPAHAFEVERLGDDADGEDAGLLGAARDHRRGAGAGAAAHAGGDEHHVRALEVIADLVDRLFGRGAPDFRLRAGAEPFGDGHAHLDDALGLGHGERLGVGVGDDEVDALQPARDHVVDGVAAGAAGPEHGDPRLELTDVGNLQIDAHVCLFIRGSRRRVGPVRHRPLGMSCRVIRSSREAIVRPVRYSRSPVSRVPRSSRFEMLKMRRLRIDQQSRRDGERRSLRFLGQPADAERPADPHRTAENARGELRQAR